MAAVAKQEDPDEEGLGVQYKLSCNWLLMFNLCSPGQRPVQLMLQETY